MKLKTYTAANMSTALAMVKRDLGLDAVILHTRKYKKRTFFGIGGHDVVEITASDGAELNQRRERVRRRVEPIATSMPKPRLSDAMPAMAGSAMAGSLSEIPVAGGRVPSRPPHPAPTTNSSVSTQELIRRTYAAAMAQAEQTQDASAPERVSMPGGSYGASGTLASVDALASLAVGGGQEPSQSAASAASVASEPEAVGASPDQLAGEMRAVKRMVSQMMQRQDETAMRDVPDELFDQYLALLEQEVTQELATEVITQVRNDLLQEDLVDSEKVRDALRAALSALIPTDPNVGQWSDANRPGRPVGPRKIALIGPTGVGKTTTVAKLAANLKLKQGKNVALITLDTYRIAAVDQLRTYANIIGVPLHVVMSPSELHDALARCADRDAVLIDTAGRSQRDDPRLDQLHEFLKVADPDEVHLVLSSTGSQKVLMEIVERFSRTRIDHIIFTKLDEAVSFGVLLNVARKVNKALSYVTTGQEVPHHIEAGTSDRLASLLLGGQV